MVVVALGKNLLFKSVLAHCALACDVIFNFLNSVPIINYSFQSFDFRIVFEKELF